MRIVLAIGWKQKFIRRFELLALPYCAAYLVWSYTSSNTSSIPFVATIGISSGLFIGLVSLFSASRVGQNVDAWESRFFAAIAKKFRRDNDEP